MESSSKWTRNLGFQPGQCGFEPRRLYMITLQEIEPVEAPDINENIDYCHILCCHPAITLCGAYKPERCGVYFVVGEDESPLICPACHRQTCPDCLERVFDACPWCD
jgi:hypothetical protein